MKLFVCILFIVSLIALHCQRSEPVPDPAGVRNEAQRVLDAMSDSLRSGGLTGWIPFLHNSPEFTWEFHGHASSYDTLVAQIRREAPRYRSIQLAWDSVTAESAGQNVAHVTARFVENVVDVARVEETLAGTVDCEIRKVDGVWKFTKGRTVDGASRVIK